MTAGNNISVPAFAPNTSQRRFNTERGEYLVQVSWPIGWDRTDVQGGLIGVSILYILDGNAYFFSATDIARRLQSRFGQQLIVVAVGYPIVHSVYDLRRRAADLTPPSSDKIRGPPGPDGKPVEGVNWGEADRFLEVLKSCIMPEIEKQLLADLPVNILGRILFGHSFGGLFTLYTLFSETEIFDQYIAASPSIWFNHCGIVREQQSEFLKRRESRPNQIYKMRAPNLFITYGSLEQSPVRGRTEAKDKYERRKLFAAQRRMKDNILEMETQLRISRLLGNIETQELFGEDHGSAALCALQRAIKWLLDNDQSNECMQN